LPELRRLIYEAKGQGFIQRLHFKQAHPLRDALGWARLVAYRIAKTKHECSLPGFLSNEFEKSRLGLRFLM
jgi:hypothetical protein